MRNHVIKFLNYIYIKLWINFRFKILVLKNLKNYTLKIFPQKQIFIIQIGSNNGVTNDPLRHFILKYKWKGILIEPVPEIYSKLKKKYVKNKDIKTLNVAIHINKKLVNFFYLSKKILKKNNTIPIWYDQIGSFNKKNITKHFNFSINKFLKKIKVKAISFNCLIKKYKIKKLFLLHIDAEGYDGKIILSINLKKIKPNIIMFEHKHLTKIEKKIILEKLVDNFYKIKIFNDDILAIKY